MPIQRQAVLGIDSSTQSTKVVARDLESGATLAEGKATHSGLSSQDPRDWWAALVTAIRSMDLGDLEICGMAVAGQQHGLVALDVNDEPIGLAPLWNNVDAAPDAECLNVMADFAAEVGSRLVASFTIAKVAHMARTAPHDLNRTATICLPHDYLTLRLTGNLASDRSDASGTGWWSASQDRDRRDLLALAAGDTFAQRVRIARIIDPGEIAGTLTDWAAAELGLKRGLPVGPGAGDNAAAALGIGATSDEMVVSLGTSGVAYAVSDVPTFDSSGEVCGFADATGRYLPLVCMINCTQIVNQSAALIGLDVTEALDRAQSVPAGANGVWMIPYLGGERTPNLPYASAEIRGMSIVNYRPENVLRAAVDGVAAGLAYCLEALDRVGIRKQIVTLVGGGSRHPAWQHAIADATGLSVQVRAGVEHVAGGAAVQIAAILANESVTAQSETWKPEVVDCVHPDPAQREMFRLEERRAVIEEIRHRKV
jgi:xylulokinase